jgi:transcription antitermination factor NusG
MKENEKKWLAIYTKPRWEKKVHGTLVHKQIESWCPLQKVTRQWSDRKKIIEDPIFKSYVFVHITDDERLRVLQTEGVLNFVYYLGKPAIIKDEEVANIKSYLLENDVSFEIQSLRSFAENDKVIIKQGVFMDNIGTVVKSGVRKLYVRLESLDQVMIVEFPASFVEPHLKFYNH